MMQTADIKTSYNYTDLDSLRRETEVIYSYSDFKMTNILGKHTRLL